MGLLDGLSGAGDYLSDPNNAAQLGLISGVLNASGPSRMPVSFGQVLGAGFQGANTAQNQAQDQILKQYDIQQKQLQVMGAARTQALINDYMQRNGIRSPNANSLLPDQTQGPLLNPQQPPTTGLGAAPMPQQGQPMPQGQQPQGMPQSQGMQNGMTNGGLPMDSLMQGMITGAVGGPTAEKAYYDNIKTTDFNKQLMQMGVDPNSALGHQLQQNYIAKQNYIAPTALRTDKYIDPITGEVKFAPTAAPDTYMTVKDPSQPTGYSYVQVGGGATALQNNALAQESGKRGYAPSGNASPTLPPSPNNPASQGSPAIAGIPSKFGPASDAQVAAVGAGLKAQQDAMSNTWKDLSAANQSSPTVIARLQTIKTLAPDAIVGSGSDVKKQINDIFSSMGVKDATQYKTANDLLDKNKAQLIGTVRQSMGGAGTDAFQTLMDAATPGSHMSLPAIQEAADTLIAGQKLVAAKAQFVKGNYQNLDSPGFINKSTQFDSNADYRLFQMQDMNPKQQQNFVSKLSPSDAKDLAVKHAWMVNNGIMQ